MKNIFLTICAVFTATVFLGCDFFSGSKANANFDKDESYAYGLELGTRLKDGMAADAIRPVFNEFLKGFKDGIQGKKPKFSIDDAKVKIELAKAKVAVEKDAITKQRGISFLADNAKKPGIQATKSGLQYEVLTEGKGKKPTETDSVKVHYEGRLIDGTPFEPQQTVTVALADVIPGWKEGLQLMTAGSKYRFYVPYELGYGAEGSKTPDVPPYSVLLFVVELDSIVSKRAAPVEDEWSSWGW